MPISEPKPFRPFERVSGDPTLGLVLMCDHARNALPEAYGDLGLPAAAFERHIAFDIGAEAVTRELARLTGAPAVMSTFSRLLIDPNRGEDDPTLIRQLYDGTVIPGNYPLSEEERELRLDRFYRPYHTAVSELVAEVAAASGRAPLLISMHSFTPQLGSRRPRPWQVGVLWDRDGRAALPLIETLRAEPDLVVGDNEPYDGALRGDAMFRHAIVPGYPHALIELRQDLIGTQDAAEGWAARLAPIIEAINRRPDMREAQQFGSRTGPIEELAP